VIPPGQVGEIKAKLNTLTLSGMVGKGISVFTNDPITPNIQVVIKARVVGSAIVKPGYKGFLSNRQVETRSLPFLIRKEPGEFGDLDITEASASVDWIDVEVRKLTERWPAQKGLPSGIPGEWLMVVQLKQDPPYGQGTEEIRFNTGLKLEPVVRLSIATDVRPPVNLNFSELSLVSGEPSTFLVSLRRDLEPQPVKLTAPEGLSARAESGGGRFFKVHLEWSGPAPTEPLELGMEVGGETQTVPIAVVDAN